MSAVISDCGNYRYVLKRDVPQMVRWVKPVLFIMLNPSTADADTNDPTIRSCLRLTKAWGGTRLTVVNLFAFRTPFPKTMMTADDPEGEQNDFWIRETVAQHKNTGIIVAAWGTLKFAQRRAEYVTNHFGPFQCLGKNKNGSPRHPLFLAANTPLEPYK